MKAAFLLGLVLFPLGALHATDTAYSALRVLGKRDGQEVLNHVVEVRGHDGTPQPGVWKIVIDDPRARGGVREVEVQRGKIVSERTPTSHGVGGAMNFNQLNLDSEGAFTVANQEAQKTNVPFDHIDYVLRAGTGGGAPVWQLELADGKNGRVGSVEVAADSGTVLRRQFDICATRRTTITRISTSTTMRRRGTRRMIPTKAAFPNRANPSATCRTSSIGSATASKSAKPNWKISSPAKASPTTTTATEPKRCSQKRLVTD